MKVEIKNDFLNLILDSLDYPFLIIDPANYTISLANSAAHTGQLSTGLTCYALTHKRDTPCNSAEDPCPIEIIKKAKKPVTMEHIHYDKDGNPRYIEVHAFPVMDSNGNVSQVIEYTIDVTERKRAEAALLENEKRYRQLFLQDKQHTEMLAALNAVSYTVNQTLNLDKLLNDVLKNMVKLLRADGGHIRLLDDTEQELVIIAHQGFSPEQIAKMNIKRNSGVGDSWQSLKAGQVRFTEYNPNDSYQNNTKSFGVRIGARCSVHFTIFCKDKKLGVMTFYSFSPWKYTRQEIEQTAIIGHQVGVAIENAKLYQQTQHTVKSLKQAQEERERLVSDLQKTLSEVKTLRGFLPICSNCKKIRDDKGYWNQIESYIQKYSDAEFSHSICPECAKELYPDLDIYDDNGEVTQD